MDRAGAGACEDAYDLAVIGVERSQFGTYVDDRAQFLLGLVPAECLKTGQGTFRESAAATANHEVGDQVGHSDQDDEIAERDDLIGKRKRDDVAEPLDDRVVVGEFARTRQSDPFQLVGLDHAGVDERLGPHGCGAIQRNGYEIGDDADPDDRHAGEEQVAHDEGQGGDKPGESPPPGTRKFEGVSGDADTHGDHEQGQCAHAGLGYRPQTALAGDAGDESGDDGHRQRREEHGESLPVVPADPTTP